LFEEVAKKRMAEGGKNKGGEKRPTRRAREDAAKVFKVSDKYVQQAKAVVLGTPDLAAQVLSIPPGCRERAAPVRRWSGPARRT
jgi:hypothetical protein